MQVLEKIKKQFSANPDVFRVCIPLPFQLLPSQRAVSVLDQWDVKADGTYAELRAERDGKPFIWVRRDSRQPKKASFGLHEIECLLMRHGEGLPKCEREPRHLEIITTDDDVARATSKDVLAAADAATYAFVWANDHTSRRTAL